MPPPILPVDSSAGGGGVPGDSSAGAVDSSAGGGGVPGDSSAANFSLPVCNLISH